MGPGICEIGSTGWDPGIAVTLECGHDCIFECGPLKAESADDCCDTGSELSPKIRFGGGGEDLHFAAEFQCRLRTLPLVWIAEL